jgi:hypothetical protein
MITSGEPALESILLVLVLVGVASFGITETVKIWGRKYSPKKDGIPDSIWWQVAFRIIPIATGAGLGQWFMPFPWGVTTGVCSGILAALLYRRVKKIISSGDPPSNFLSP